MSEVHEDMNRSSQCFRNYIWDMCKDYIGGGTLIPLEDQYESLQKLLDMDGGADYLQKTKLGLNFLCTRIQVCEEPYEPYNSFTVRVSRDSGAETELGKRKREIQNDLHYPKTWIQAYVRDWDGPVLTIGIAKTEDIITWSVQNQFSAKKKYSGNSNFLIVPWDEFERDGYKVTKITVE